MSIPQRSIPQRSASRPGPRFVTRVARLLPERGPAEPVEIAAAPSAPDAERGWLAMLLPGLSALGMLGFALLSPNVLIIALSGGVAVVSAVAAVWAGRAARRRRDRAWAVRRERYRGHLAGRVRVLADAASRQRVYELAAHPPPDAAATAVDDHSVWDRSPDHGDYLHVRVGIGRAPARRPPRLPSGGGDPDGDPELLAAAADAIGRHACVDATPISLELAPGQAIVITADLLPLLRAFIVSLTRAHGPDVVRLHAVASEAERKWMRRLPHAGCMTADVAELLATLRPQFRGAAASTGDGLHHVVVLATGDDLTGHVFQGFATQLRQHPPPMSVLALLPPGAPVPSEAALVISGDANGGVLVTRPGLRPEVSVVARPDSLAYTQATWFAEALSLVAGAGPAALPASTPLLLQTLLGVPPNHPLTVPIGVADDDSLVTLDLREAARGGDGPHGLVIGATGSGKSELLRTLLIAAAHQSPPGELAFLLVDYKGGAAFTELSRLPHTAGLLTNLTADLQAVDRLCASLRAELRHRQRTLRDAGVDDIDSYRVRVPNADPMPRLLVVVDEYAELLEESPEVLDVLTSLGRLGRSLGIHLLLSSQRLDDGRLRGLDAHLRFRICLRTFAAAESVAVIGTPAAAELPAAPGLAWLSRDGALTRLRVALVGTPSDAVSAVLARRGQQATAHPRPVCQPPLPDVLTLDRLRVEEGQAPPAVTVTAVTAVAAVAIAEVGLLDLPEVGQQPPLILDLAGPAGHLAVAGAPRSGRSTVLASVVAALAVNIPPRELSIHVVALASSVLTGIAGLPHVGTVATSAELAGRVIHAVADAVTERQSPGVLPGPRILLVVDDVAAALNTGDALAADLVRIATLGLSVGVSLALSCGRWTELRGGLREAIGSRWELRLNDPSDSMLPHVARRRSRPIAGRILTSDGSWAQIALPRIDGAATPAGLPEGLADLVATVARRGGPATRPIQLLPTRVPAHALPRPSRPGRFPIGVSGTYAEPVEIGLAPGEHLVVLGNSGSGRSGLLRAIAATVQDQGSRLWLIDPRRSLSCLADDSHRRAFAPRDASGLIEELATSCVNDPSSCGAQPPDVLVIDDLDLAAGRGAAGSGAASPFAPLAELLPFAADLGLSVVVARRASGSSRAAFEPFFGQLLELCDSGVLLSGDPAEGPVMGGLRPRPRPPGRGHLVLRGEAAGELQTVWRDDLPPPAVHSSGVSTGSRTLSGDGHGDSPRREG